MSHDGNGLPDARPTVIMPPGAMEANAMELDFDTPASEHTQEAQPSQRPAIPPPPLELPHDSPPSSGGKSSRKDRKKLPRQDFGLNEQWAREAALDRATGRSPIAAPPSQPRIPDSVLIEKS